MVGLEAMSAYSIKTLSTVPTHLTVRIGTPERREDYTITLTDTNEGIQKMLEVHNYSLFNLFCSNRISVGLVGVAFLTLSNHLFFNNLIFKKQPNNPNNLFKEKNKSTSA